MGSVLEQETSCGKVRERRQGGLLADSGTETRKMERKGKSDESSSAQSVRTKQRRKKKKKEEGKSNRKRNGYLAGAQVEFTERDIHAQP